MEAAVGLARDLSAVGIDPGETLLNSVETLAETVGDDRELLATLLDAIHRFIVALDERGVHATYPIQQGLSATVAAWSANPAGLPDALAAFCSQDSVRYKRMAQAKLAPRRRIGKGLLRGVARTCEAHAQGGIDRDTAKDRLEPVSYTHLTLPTIYSV